MNKKITTIRFNNHKIVSGYQLFVNIIGFCLREKTKDKIYTQAAQALTANQNAKNPKISSVGKNVEGSLVLWGKTMNDSSLKPIGQQERAIDGKFYQCYSVTYNFIKTLRYYGDFNARHYYGYIYSRLRFFFMTTHPKSGHGGNVADIVLVAAGKGSRMNLGTNKIFADILGKPLIFHTLHAVRKLTFFRRIVLVGSNVDMTTLKSLTATNFNGVELVPGGNCRAESVRNGMLRLNQHGLPDYIFVHDAARPFITHRLMSELLTHAERYGASVPATNPVETVRLCTGKSYRLQNRSTVWLMQTPQVVCADYARRYFLDSLSDHQTRTDEMSVLDYYGMPFKIIPGLRENIKITVPFDLVTAEGILRRQWDSPEILD